VLIPYDPSGPHRLWEREKHQQGDNDNIAASFVDKMFQVRFEVATLVLADWHNYLTRLLGDAFPEHVERLDVDVQFHAVYLVSPLGLYWVSRRVREKGVARNSSLRQ
jgi:hypothetical protein